MLLYLFFHYTNHLYMGYLLLNKDFSEEDVRAQLDKLLKNAALKSSSVLMSFLKYVVLETLKGKEDELKEYNIAVKGLNRPADFDPQQFALIRIYALRLRKILQRYYEGPGNNDLIQILLPKGGYKPVFRKRDLLREAMPHALPVHDQQHMVVAVFPFLNMSAAQVYDLLIDHLCEQVSMHLAAKEGMRIISYVLVRNYAVHVDDLIRVGGDLGANISVTGSISFQQNQLSITLQLIASATGVLLWTRKLQQKVRKVSVESVARQISDTIYEVLSADGLRA